MATRVIGVGVVASAVAALSAVKSIRPRRVILAGIAGVFWDHVDQQCRVGEAMFFDTVGIDGVGVGQREDYLSPRELGWDAPGWGGSPDRIPLAHPQGEWKPSRPMNVLLSVCSASANASEAAWRGERFPDARAEDMEGYAVAMACQSGGVPLMILRGFSNLVGERDKSKWQIEKALSSVASQLDQTLESGT